MISAGIESSSVMVCLVIKLPLIIADAVTALVVYKIAEKYNINPTLLASLNGLEMEDYIYPGQEILIPKNNYSYYITAEGDTLDTVSKLFKISKLDLLNQNETIYLLKDQVLVTKR